MLLVSIFQVLQNIFFCLEQFKVSDLFQVVIQRLSTEEVPGSNPGMGDNL